MFPFKIVLVQVLHFGLWSFQLTFLYFASYTLKFAYIYIQVFNWSATSAERSSFPPLIAFLVLSNKWFRYVNQSTDSYFPLTYLSISMPISPVFITIALLALKLGSVSPLALLFFKLFQLSQFYVVVVFPVNYGINFYQKTNNKQTKKPAGIFIGIALNL